MERFFTWVATLALLIVAVAVTRVREALRLATEDFLPTRRVLRTLRIEARGLRLLVVLRALTIGYTKQTQITTKE